MGYLALGELDKRNAEGADSDAGWWTERLVRTQERVRGIVVGIKELKGGDKVVKLSNLNELVKDQQPQQLKTNETAFEVYTSLSEWIKE